MCLGSSLLVFPRGYTKQRNTPASPLPKYDAFGKLTNNLFKKKKKGGEKGEKKKSIPATDYHAVAATRSAEPPWPKLPIQKAFKHMYNQVWEQAPWRQ